MKASVSASSPALGELEQARQRLSEHMENTPLAVIEFTQTFQVMRWTGQAEHIFGWKASEVVGKHFGEWEFVHPVDAADVAGVAARLMQGIELRNTSRNRNLTKSGAVINCLWHNSVVRDLEGKTVSILSFVQDVTEHERALKIIKENELLYHTLTEATNTGYVLVDSAAVVLDVNDEYVRLTGRKSHTDVKGHCVSEWIAPEDLDRFIADMPRLLEMGQARNYEVQFRTPEGELVPVEVNAKVRHDEDGPQILAFCRSLAPRRRAEAERNEIERRLLESQKLESLGVLSGGIAHDFNNLLTAVIGNVCLAAIEVGGSNRVLEDHLLQIETAATRASDLCKQLLAYSGRGRFVLEKLDLNSIIRELSNLLGFSLSKKASLKFHLEPALPLILGDPTQVRQILMNLVINASEAIGDADGSIEVRTGVMSASSEFLSGAGVGADLPEAEYVCLEIADTGSGMSAEVQTRIFEPFFTTKFVGRGLGLAATLGIVRSHRGALRVDSLAGKGTTFRVLFPKVHGATVAALPPQDQGKWRGEGIVLIVDDEEIVRATAAAMLKALGFDAVLAEDGMVGVERYEEVLRSGGRFTFVLLDCHMPRKNGAETLTELMRLDPAARVLMMSGYNEQDMLSRAPCGPAGFMEKPFRMETVRQKVREVVEAGRSR